MTATERSDGTAASRVRPPGLRGPFIAAGCAAAGTLLVATVDPNEPGHYPTCPFLFVTGWACPLCGGLRATHALAHGDVGAAFAANALVPPLLALLVLFWVSWVAHARRGRSADVPAWRRVYVGVLIVLGIFWLVRNLPGLEVLLPH